LSPRIDQNATEASHFVFFILVLWHIHAPNLRGPARPPHSHRDECEGNNHVDPAKALDLRNEPQPSELNLRISPGDTGEVSPLPHDGSMHYERAPYFRRLNLDGSPPPLRYGSGGMTVREKRRRG